MKTIFFQNCQNLGRAPLKLSKDAENKLLSHQWPGNVRELRNVMERAAILEQADEVQPENLPDFELEARLIGSSGAGDVSGDINSDDIVNILDLITFVSAILGTYDLSYEEFKCVDLNRDYKTDILDVIQLVNIILSN